VNTEIVRQGQPPAIEPATVANWLALFVRPDDVAELRALHVTQGYGKPATMAGFYDGRHLAAMSTEALKLTPRAKGVYLTINPLAPDILARCANRVQVAGTGDLAGDGHVVGRRWLYVDVDPVRLAGISANDAEKAAALIVAGAVRQHLDGLGWPPPILADSGNGYHAFYLLDLPADDGGLVQRCLAALAKRFDTDKAKVDKGVHNAARIVKLPGTLARKGDPTPERPHRRGGILEIPAEIRPTPRDLLEALAAEATPASALNPPLAAERNGKAARNHLLDVARWLSDRGVAFRVKSGVEARGRTVFVLAACPFNADHKDPDACVMQSPDGELSAKCLHNSCAGHGWKDFKAAIGPPDPDHYDPPLHAKRRPAAAGRNSRTTTGTAENADEREPHLTDMGNAQRFVLDHGANVRHCFSWRKWFVWDGRRWRVDDTGAVVRLAKATVKKLYDDAAAKLTALKDATDLDDEKKAEIANAIKQLLNHARKSEDARALGRLLDLARSEPAIPILPADLDRDPWLLNCENGTLDLHTAELKAHRQEDALTKLCATAYRQGADCPRFLRALDGIFAGDGELIQYVQTYLGYCLTGDVREQALLLCWGGGANGKTTLLNAIVETLGTDYAGYAPVELLMETRGDQHPTLLADLFGKRFVIAAETEQGRRLNEGRLKVLTGGERIKARRMREDFWEFDPTHKLILVTNHKPEVRGTDHAIWRRLRLVPFKVQFLDPDAPENAGRIILDDLRIDRGLPEALRAEREGILAWLVQGCLAWQRDGLRTPAMVHAATAEYRADQDIVGAFVAECCVTGGADYRCRSADLYARFGHWSKAAGEDPMTKKRFGDALTERGIERFQSNGWWYRGLALAQDNGPDPSE
jgi:putative DNA primase/helicase